MLFLAAEEGICYIAKPQRDLYLLRHTSSIYLVSVMWCGCPMTTCRMSLERKEGMQRDQILIKGSVTQRWKWKRREERSFQVPKSIEKLLKLPVDRLR